MTRKVHKLEKSVDPNHTFTRKRGRQVPAAEQHPLSHHPAQYHNHLKRGLSKFLHSKVAIPPFKKSIRPGNDFYAYINGIWTRSTKIPYYTSSYGVSEEVENYIQTVLLAEIRSCNTVAEEGREPTTREDELTDAIGRLAMSSLREAKQKNSIEYLKRGVRSIGCLRDEHDVGRTLGYLCRFGIPTLLNMSVSVRDGGSPTDHTDYCLNLDPGSVGLPDVSYYAALAPGKSNVLYAYTNLVQQMMKELDLDDISHVIPFEAKIAATLGLTQKEEIDISEALEIRLPELRRRYKAIAWDDLLTAYGIPETTKSRIWIHINYPEWLEFLNKLMTETPLEQWYGLFALHTFLHSLPYLPPPFDDWHFKFFSRMLRGQRKKVPQEILNLQVTKEKLSWALGYRFVKDYLTPQFKAQATQFVQKIVKAAERRMGEIEWFSPATRRRAAEKLRTMRVSVGYSEPLVAAPPPVPALQTDNFLANIYLLESAATEQSVSKLLRDPPKGLWVEPPYAVNAYYYHETNEIVIPAGSFFWPFFNQSHQDWVGWNFGGVGAVIAHEITHAFDNEGRQYDEKGGTESWWSAADEAAYKERTKELVRLFDQEKVLGRGVNGTATLNENLADLGGLGIALDALLDELKDLSDAEKGRHLRDFFVAYAVSWRTKEQPERRLQRLILDQHAPVELRVNLVVTQFEEWYEAFGVRTDDALYRPPEERIRIF